MSVPSRHRLLCPLLACVASCSATRGFGESVGDDNPTSRPDRISQTGLYASTTGGALAPGVTKFAPAYPLWSDGSEKTRYLSIPPGTKIDTRDMDGWVFPVGTKAWKEFRVGGRLIETRLFWKHRPEPGIDSWWYVSYVWSADGGEAIASPEGTRSALGTTHDVPGEIDCKGCHAYVKDGIIGFSAIELATPAPGTTTSPDPATGMLMTFARSGLFSDPPASEPRVPGEGVVRDALGYLHANCGFCHNERLSALIHRTILLGLRVGDATPEQTGPYTTTFGVKMFHAMEGGADVAVTPGDPDKSQLYRRMVSDGLWRMPPKGTKVIDPTGSAAVRAWILGLPR